jgi:uncharacterized protein YbjT (DUF2867 family)
MNKVILVTGATGNQGGAVVNHLLELGFSVRAVSRNLNSSASAKLKDKGVEVVYGDLDKPETLPPIFRGVYGVYSVQNNWTSNVKTEVKQGKAVANAAKEAEVQHLVYSSVGGAERNTGIPHFDSKYEIERYIVSLKLAYTFVRPAFFVENLLEQGTMKFVTWSLLSWALKGHKKLQFICVDDIGAYVALAFSKPEKYLGKEIELAGDEKSFDQIKSIFTAASGSAPTHFSIPAWLLAPMNKEASTMFSWFKHHGYQADIGVIRKEMPKVKSLDNALHYLFKN